MFHAALILAVCKISPSVGGAHYVIARKLTVLALNLFKAPELDSLETKKKLVESCGK